jgi:hypothetical protein
MRNCLLCDVPGKLSLLNVHENWCREAGREGGEGERERYCVLHTAQARVRSRIGRIRILDSAYSFVRFSSVTARLLVSPVPDGRVFNRTIIPTATSMTSVREGVRESEVDVEIWVWNVVKIFLLYHVTNSSRSYLFCRAPRVDCLPMYGYRKGIAGCSHIMSHFLSVLGGHHLACRQHPVLKAR